MPRLAIIGLGLIGSSLGLALRAKGPHDLEVVGFDADPDALRQAQRMGAVANAAKSATRAAEGASVVVIATPVLQVQRVLEEIASTLDEGAVVTDTASTKREVLRWAEELLPETVSFVGGHPIAGKEASGPQAAEASLFEGRAWAVTPSLRAEEAAVRAVEALVKLVGARPIIIDPEEHDSYLAAVSHLPLVLATALFSLARESQAWPELGVLAGPGFRDMTRLASGNPEMSHDICLTNRDHLTHWIDRFIEELRRYQQMIRQEDLQEELYKHFARAQLERDAFLQRPPERPRPEQQAEQVSAGEQMLRFMMGEYLTRRAREVEQMLEQRAKEDQERLRRELEGR